MCPNVCGDHSKVAYILFLMTKQFDKVYAQLVIWEHLQTKSFDKLSMLTDRKLAKSWEKNLLKLDSIYQQAHDV